MEKVKFEYYETYSDGQEGEHVTCEAELKDDEWEKLKEFYKNHPGEKAFDHADYKDIYEKFLEAAIDDEKERLLDYGEVEKFLKDTEYDEEDEEFDPDDEDYDEHDLNEELDPDDDFEPSDEELKRYFTERVQLRIVEKVPVA